MRACVGWRSSDRKNSGRTNVEVWIRTDWKIAEADQNQNLEKEQEHNQLRRRAKNRLGVARRGGEHSLRVTRAQDSRKTFGMYTFASLGGAGFACCLH